MSSSSPSADSPAGPAPGTAPPGGLRASVVIPTYKRPDELRVCLRSILAQTVKPHEVIVIDDGDLAEWPLESEFRAAGVLYLGHRKSPPGLTASRNAGIRLAKGDVILFFDDDTELLPDYVERVLATYAADAQSRVGGVAGWVVNPKPFRLPQRLRWLWDVFFLNSGWREGRVLPSGFCVDFGTTPFPVTTERDVQFMPGCAASFRKEVFAQAEFSAEYVGYGLGEDKDFSRRIADRYRLVVQPLAKLHHYESPKMRYDKRRRAREVVHFRLRFFRTYARRGWWSWAAFAHGLLGWLLARTAIALLSFDRSEWGRVRGILEGIADVMRGRGPAQA